MNNLIKHWCRRRASYTPGQAAAVSTWPGSHARQPLADPMHRPHLFHAINTSSTSKQGLCRHHGHVPTHRRTARS